MQAQNRKDPRSRLLSALFSKSLKAGIAAEKLRNDIAPDVLGKRISEASAQELFKLIEHITGLYPAIGERPIGSIKDNRFKYFSSRTGLIEELEDSARARWGADWERSLNSFINSNRKAPTHWKFLRVADAKAVKERLKEMNERDVAFNRIP